MGEEREEALGGAPVAVDLELAGSHRAVMPEHVLENSRLGRDRGDRIGGLSSRRLEGELAHPERERRLAKPELEGLVAQALGPLGIEHRLQREHHRVDAELAPLRRERRLASPPAEGEHDRLELPAPVGQLVHARAGRRGELGALHDARLLELAQPLGQHVRADVGQAGAQVGEALGPEQQLANHEQRPSLPDEVERAGDPAGVSVRTHAHSLSLDSLSIQL